MSDALVFGARNSQASPLADALSDVLRVPVRYKREAADDGRPGVAICVNAASFTTDAGILVFADDVLRDPKTGDAEREAALGVLSEALALGRYVAVIPSKDSAKLWKSYMKSTGVPAGRRLKRILLAGSDAGDSFGSQVASALGIRVIPDEDESMTGDGPELDERLKGREASADADDWLAASSSWRVAELMAPKADLVVYFEFAESREGSVQPPRLHERLLVGAFRRGMPLSDEKLLRNKLAEFAHLTPVLRVRNEAERDAVLAGLLRGAASGAG